MSEAGAHLWCIADLDSGLPLKDVAARIKSLLTHFPGLHIICRSLKPEPAEHQRLYDALCAPLSDELRKRVLWRIEPLLWHWAEANVRSGLHLCARGWSFLPSPWPHGPLTMARHRGDPPPPQGQSPDAWLVSPIFSTQCKPGVAPWGLQALRTQQIPEGLKRIALGGITLESAEACKEAGAAGIALASGIWGAPDPLKACAAYDRVWNTKHEMKTKILAKEQKRLDSRPKEGPCWIGTGQG